MPVVLSVELANDTVADADDVMQNFNDLAAKFTEGPGGIGDDDFTEEAGRKLDGSKIATDSIEGTSLKEEAVTETKLAADYTDSSGTDALRAVSGYHIKSLTAAHLARILLANGIALDKLKITLATAAISLNFAGTGNDVATLTMDGTFAKATYDCLGAYIKNPAGSATTAIVVLHPDDTGATNWALKVRGTMGDPSPLTFTGTAVAVFITKVT